MRKLTYALSLLSALLLAACGGGASLGDGGDGGSVGGGTTGGSTTGGDTDPIGVQPASLTLLLSSPQLSSHASTIADGVTLTAITKDANNNVLPDVTVQFSTTDSAEINVVNPAITDANGRATAVVTTGGDPANRTIRIKATAGSLSADSTIDVIGTTLSLSGPDSTQLSTDTVYTILLADSAGTGISGQVVALTTDMGNAVTPAGPVTDASGQATFKLNASQANTTLTAAALGLTASKAIKVSTDKFTFTTPAAATEVKVGTSQEIRVQWQQNGAAIADGTEVDFTATRGVFANGSSTTSAVMSGGVASVMISSSQAGPVDIVATSSMLTKPSATRSFEFIAFEPASISVQASPAVVPTNQKSTISVIVRDANNNLVKNATVNFSLSDLTGGSLSSPNAVTNSQGVATTTYTATSQTSASKAVVVTVQVHGTTINDQAMLTVGGQAVSIVFGAGTEIIAEDESTYQYPWTVLITDSAGNPVTNAQFTMSLTLGSVPGVPNHYLKGTITTNADGSPNVSGATVCVDEDANLNGILDPGEDINDNRILEPGRVANVSVSPSTPVIRPDGTQQWLVTYPKEYGRFVEVTLTGVATVSGSETTAQRMFWLPIADGDEEHLSSTSPFGTGSCSDPN